ncbi:hypothetical protein GRI97_17280 [Altererythrobacter xixiisoli]|uniref:Uncharacterized protein n=1 Tax=Croceibacterium xixiisoli TaxID=1476466 RepID=A0A6I4TX56_9SPHN|nr:hypothetical protein [Croceibacterium xixiisoli]MXP00746.1 hypothetical protein [Croceibacterium xixiisoli]
MDPASTPDIIAARTDRAAQAQGHGVDMGLYAATPGAFPAIAATNFGLALIPAAVSAQEQGAGAFDFQLSEASPLTGAAISGDAPGAAAPITMDTQLGGGMALPTLDMAMPLAPAVGSAGAAPVASAEQMLLGMDAQGLLALSPTAQAAPAAQNAVAPAPAAASGTDALAAALIPPAIPPALAPVQQTVEVLGTQTEATLAAALDTVEGLATSVEGLVADQLVTLDNRLDAVTGQIDALLDTVPVLDIPATLESVTSLDTLRTLDTVETLGASAVQLPAAVVAPIAESVAPVVTQVVAPVIAPVIAPVAPVLDNTLDTVTDTVAAVTAPLVDPVADTLEGLAGADPAGGVATLTSMVSAADVFAVSDDAPTEIGLADGIGSLGMLDMLAPPAIDAVLLGGDDPLHDALSPLDDLHLGLG